MKLRTNLILVVAAFGLLIPEIATPASSKQRRAAAETLPPGVTAKDATFYSEGVQCQGRIFLPREHSVEKKLAAVVLAPGWGETAASIEPYASLFAARGLVAMVIDYRGWGRSGGYVQTVEQVRSDDRLRFSEMTAVVRIRRKRLLPQQQILDIRNALYFLQGEPGVDRARIGVWGPDMAAGHVLVVAAVDARIKAVVAQTPVIAGSEVPKKASTPAAAMLRAEQIRARTGQFPVRPGVAVDYETQIALSEYHPFWLVDQIPAKTAVLFVIAEKDLKTNDAAVAASKLLTGPTEVARIPGAAKSDLGRGTALEAAAKAAADWFLKYL